MGIHLLHTHYLDPMGNPIPKLSDNPRRTGRARQIVPPNPNAQPEPGPSAEWDEPPTEQGRATPSAPPKWVNKSFEFFIVKALAPLLPKVNKAESDDEPSSYNEGDLVNFKLPGRSKWMASFGGGGVQPDRHINGVVDRHQSRVPPGYVSVHWPSENGPTSTLIHSKYVQPGHSDEATHGYLSDAGLFRRGFARGQERSRFGAPSPGVPLPPTYTKFSYFNPTMRNPQDPTERTFEQPESGGSLLSEGSYGPWPGSKQYGDNPEAEGEALGRRIVWNSANNPFASRILKALKHIAKAEGFEPGDAVHYLHNHANWEQALNGKIVGGPYEQHQPIEGMQIRQMNPGPHYLVDHGPLMGGGGNSTWLVPAAELKAGFHPYAANPFPNMGPPPSPLDKYPERFGHPISPVGPLSGGPREEEGGITARGANPSGLYEGDANRPPHEKPRMTRNDISEQVMNSAGSITKADDPFADINDWQLNDEIDALQEQLRMNYYENEPGYIDPEEDQTRNRLNDLIGEAERRTDAAWGKYKEAHGMHPDTSPMVEGKDYTTPEYQNFYDEYQNSIDQLKPRPTPIHPRQMSNSFLIQSHLLRPRPDTLVELQRRGMDIPKFDDDQLDAISDMSGGLPSPRRAPGLEGLFGPKLSPVPEEAQNVGQQQAGGSNAQNSWMRYADTIPGLASQGTPKSPQGFGPKFKPDMSSQVMNSARNDFAARIFKALGITKAEGEFKMGDPVHYGSGDTLTNAHIDKVHDIGNRYTIRYMMPSGKRYGWLETTGDRLTAGHNPDAINAQFYPKPRLPRANRNDEMFETGFRQGQEERKESERILGPEYYPPTTLNDPKYIVSDPTNRNMPRRVYNPGAAEEEQIGVADNPENPQWGGGTKPAGSPRTPTAEDYAKFDTYPVSRWGSEIERNRGLEAGKDIGRNIVLNAAHIEIPFLKHRGHTWPYEPDPGIDPEWNAENAKLDHQLTDVYEPHNVNSPWIGRAGMMMDPGGTSGPFPAMITHDFDNGHFGVITGVNNDSRSYMVPKDHMMSPDGRFDDVNAFPEPGYGRIFEKGPYPDEEGLPWHFRPDHFEHNEENNMLGLHVLDENDQPLGYVSHTSLGRGIVTPHGMVPDTSEHMNARENGWPLETVQGYVPSLANINRVKADPMVPPGHTPPASSEPSLPDENEPKEPGGDLHSIWRAARELEAYATT
jgi:hypothetical protein